MSSAGGSWGGGGSVISAPLGRGDFIEGIISDFETRRVGVERPVVGYILNEVLAPEDEWRAGIENDRFDLERVRALITESLEHAASVAERRDRIVIDEPLARASFMAVIHERNNCAFPFLIC
jgi:hypothetical protein